MSDGAGRRVGLALAAYGCIAAVVWLLGGWLRGVLALPPSFRTGMVVLIALGAPLAAAVAWRYPEMGGAGGDASAGDRGSDRL